MGRTDIAAAAALHAQRHLLLLQQGRALVLVFHLHRAGEGRGVEPQRADGHAAAAVDAGRGLDLFGVLAVHDHDRVCRLEDGGVERVDGLAHHGAAVEDLAGLFLQPAAGLDQVADRAADRHDQVFRLPDGGAIDRDNALDERHAGREVFRSLDKRGDVDDDDAQACQTLSRADDLAGGVVEQHLLGALGIDAVKRHDLDRGVVLEARGQLLDGVGLVLFDADDILLGLQELLEQGDPLFDQIAAFEHDAVVAGDEWLALRAVNENGVDVALLRGGELGPHGEGRAAESHHAAFAHALEELVEVGRLRDLQIRAFFHLAVALDADGRGLAPAGGVGLDGLDRAGDRGVHRRAVAALLTRDQLADRDMLPDLYDRLGRLAGVHVHRQQHLLGHCHAHGRHAGRAFVMG